MNETHLDIFSGLGCWAIAAHANGIRTVGFCEREEWLAAGLERIWKVPCHRAIEAFPAQDYAGRVWLLTGSPPCQPASLAGKRRDKADDRWLWDETVDVCKVIQPDWFIFENPPGIDGVGLDGIISDLEGLQYEVATLRIPACAVDSAQDRDRFWIVGHAECQPSGSGRPNGQEAREENRLATQSSPLANGRDSGQQECASQPGNAGQEQQADERDAAGGAVAAGTTQRACDDLQSPANNESDQQNGIPWKFRGATSQSDFEWITFNDRLYRVPTDLHQLAVQFAAGIPKKFRRRLISALGNAIHWQVAANIIGAIKTASLTP